MLTVLAAPAFARLLPADDTLPKGQPAAARYEPMATRSPFTAPTAATPPPMPEPVPAGPHWWDQMVVTLAHGTGVAPIFAAVIDQSQRQALLLLETNKPDEDSGLVLAEVQWNEQGNQSTVVVRRGAEIAPPLRFDPAAATSVPATPPFADSKHGKGARSGAAASAWFYRHASPAAAHSAQCCAPRRAHPTASRRASETTDGHPACSSAAPIPRKARAGICPAANSLKNKSGQSRDCPPHFGRAILSGPSRRDRCRSDAVPGYIYGVGELPVAAVPSENGVMHPDVRLLRYGAEDDARSVQPEIVLPISKQPSSASMP